MSSAPRGPFVRLTTLADPAAADLCAALLRSAGIDSRLRGEALGPYRLTVGGMAATEVWVPEAELEDARAILSEAPEADEAIAPDEAPAADEATPGLGRWWVAVALGLLAFLAWRLLDRLL